jgi:hypothetical protein
MSDKTGGQWRQASVVVRSDILLKAAEMGLDISDELNRRLAELVGIDYRQQPLADRPLPDPEIRAAATAGKPDDGAKQRLPSPVLHPVINADDPAAATKVRKAKRELPPEPVPAVSVPGASPQQETVISPEYPVPRVPQRGRGKKSESTKKGKDEDLKKFVSAMITRIDADDAVIPKEEMYLAFTRWCLDHRVAPVPDRKVFATLLKNKFAIIEKTVDGTSCWINVRLG